MRLVFGIAVLSLPSICASAQQGEPIAQELYIKALNSDIEDRFGRSLALDGEWLIVGAEGEDGAGQGVNADPSSNAASYAGAAYILKRGLDGWVEEAYLKASNADNDHLFGFSVGISGNLAVVGAPHENGSNTGVNPMSLPQNSTRAGAAYVFVRNGTTWTQEAYLKASNTDTNDRFGTSVAISGDTLVVGAVYEDSSATGIDGNDQDNGAISSGAAYVFRRNGTAWVQEAYLKASNAELGDIFGQSVAIDGDTIVVGALGEASETNGVNGDQLDNLASGAGAAYVFTRSGSTWTQQAYLKASNSEWMDHFGHTVALDGDRIAVAATAEASSVSGLDGNQADNNQPASGAVYVFQRTGLTWAQDVYVKASNAQANDRFGYSLGLRNNQLAVGAYAESSQSTGWNGDPFNNDYNRAGATYLFRLRNGVWRERAYLKPSHPGNSDQFGIGLALGEYLLVVGANQEDGGMGGPGGTPDDESAPNSGAAYLFDLSVEEANHCGPARLNSVGLAAQISTTGTPYVGFNNLGLRVEGVPPGRFGYFLNGFAQDYVPFAGGSQGTLCLGGGFGIGRHHETLQAASASGVLEAPINLNGMPTANGFVLALPFETWHFQAWYRDQNPGPTSNFSDAIAVRIQ